MSNQNYKQSSKNIPSVQSRKHTKHNEEKSIILERLQNYKEELNDSTRNSIKLLPLTSEDLGISPVALQLMENKTGEIQESLDEKTQRHTIASAVQKLIENVDTDVIVKVNTPAIDLNKDFDKEQLKFIKNDIFNSIQSQLGAELNEDVQERWETAFNTMMDIVSAEKKRS